MVVYVGEKLHSQICRNMIGQLLNILNLCGKHYFFKPIISNSAQNVVLSYNYGPPGELLRNNIYQEWLLGSVMNAEENFLPFSSPENGDTFEAIKDSFVHAKQLCCDKLPFGISHSKVETLITKSDSILLKHFKEAGSGYFHPDRHTSLRVYLFTHPSSSVQAFNCWQRQRKAWWRKFSGSPGRYMLTDVKSLPLGELVMIRSEYPWGMECLEAICLRGTSPFDGLDGLTRKEFEVKDGRRSILPHVIECVTTLDGAMLAFLCDAYRERCFPSHSKMTTNSSENNIRLTLHLHRRLAPFKVSFSASSSNSPLSEDLSDLASFLTRQLRRDGIPVLLSPELTKKSLEAQHLRNDEMGIPYTIVMNESTLKNGIIGLRSRDTTLKEQLHITDLKSHMKKLLKNY